MMISVTAKYRSVHERAQRVIGHHPPQSYRVVFSFSALLPLSLAAGLL